MTDTRYRPTRWQVLHEGAEVFAVSIDDEGGGRFLSVVDTSETGDDGFGLPIDPEEWPALRDAIEHALSYMHADAAQPSPAKPTDRMRELSVLYTQLSECHDAMADQCDVALAGIIADEHRTRARIARRLAGEYQDAAEQIQERRLPDRLFRTRLVAYIKRCNASLAVRRWRIRERLRTP
jgi:hypothetical protein